MDPASIILPGAQALVTQILTDGWAKARGWLAQRLAGPDGPATADLERRLDTAYAQADALPGLEAGVPEAAARRMALEAYWAGYLAALAGERPDFAAALTELADERAAQAARTSNSVTGTVTGNVLQAGHIEGGVHFG